MSIKFCDRLKCARNNKGISQKKLAEYLFVSQQTVAKWETDKATPNPETIAKISETLNVSTDYLLGNTDDVTQRPGQSNIKFDDFSYAMYNESRDLSEDDKQRLLTFARMLRETIEKDEHLNDKKQ